MLLKTDSINYNLLLDETSLQSNKKPVIFLHGFTGCADDWLFMFNNLPDEFYPAAIDLIGHGKTDSPLNVNSYSTESITQQLYEIINQIGSEKIILAGYSMGGRAALSFAIKYPEKISALILESVSPGIEEFDEKKERVKFDFLLSEKIKRDGVESFIDFWLNTPLFESLKGHSSYSQVIQKRIENNITGLSNILEGFSTGIMPCYWNKINSINFPVLLISGELDAKYTSLNSKMAKLIPGAIHKVVELCGHNVHLEKPEHFSNLVCKFLESLEKG